MQDTRIFHNYNVWLVDLEPIFGELAQLVRKPFLLSAIPVLHWWIISWLKTIYTTGIYEYKYNIQGPESGVAVSSLNQRHRWI